MRGAYPVADVAHKHLARVGLASALPVASAGPRSCCHAGLDFTLAVCFSFNWKNHEPIQFHLHVHVQAMRLQLQFHGRVYNACTV